ncbi:MAG: hypothetical protein ORO03_09280, partial [Alphaproteobacteria bacterium]|nr:hypothetical protein [Alphaproteobacteria bacterium]
MTELISWRNMTLTFEDFRQSEINEVINQEQGKIVFFVPKLMSLRTKHYNNGKHSLSMVANLFICSIHWVSHLWQKSKTQPYKVKIFERICLESEFEKTISINDIKFLYSVYNEINNPLLKAIICEVILCDKNCPERINVAHTAIDCTLKTPYVYKPIPIVLSNDEIDKESYFDYFSRLSKTHKIALIFNFK